MEKPRPNPIELPETITVSELNEETRNIIRHFGLNAPELLNNYCCSLEDALVEQMKNLANKISRIKQLTSILEEHGITVPPLYKLHPECLE